MRHGSFPGQEEALRARSAELQASSGKATRRMFLGIGLGVVAGGAAVRVLTATGSEAPTAGSAPETARDVDRGAEAEWLRERAKGPLDKLLERQLDYIVAINQRTTIDDTMWIGVVRLANLAVELDARTLRATVRLLTTLRKKPDLPGPVRAWIDLVEERSR